MRGARLMKERWREWLGAVKKRAASVASRGDLVTEGRKILARYLRTTLGRCPACGADFADHLFTQFAITVYTVETQRRAEDFLLAVRERRWRDVLKFKEFENVSDALVARAIRCPGRQIVVLVMLDPYDFYDTMSIAEQQVLDHDSSRELESLINRDEWEPLA